MKLPGRLCRTTLGDLLGMLHRAEACGVLELEEIAGATSGRTHRVHFEEGLITRVETPARGFRLAELVRELNLIGDRTYADLLARLQREPRRRTGDLLVETELVSPAMLRATLRQQQRRRLEGLFGIGDALVRFHVRWQRPDAEQSRLSPREFLHGRARARDRTDFSQPPAGNAYSSSGRRPGYAWPPRPRSSRGDDVREQALRLLGLRGQPDRRTVQRAFRSLASQLHPDRHPKATPGERAELIRKFAELSRAYHCLI